MRIRKLKCSFCRKTEDQIAKLVAGRRTRAGFTPYICNECVAAAEAIMRGDTPPAPTGPASWLGRATARYRRLRQRTAWFPQTP